MSMVARGMFAKALSKMLVSRFKPSERKARLRALAEGFLAFGSETPDNVQCIEHIDYGLLPIRWGVPVRRAALKIKGKSIGLAELAHEVEGSRIPASVRREYPELTTQEWHAFQRLVTMILIALEEELPKPRR
jgi:hypothetical protein